MPTQIVSMCGDDVVTRFSKGRGVNVDCGMGIGFCNLRGLGRGSILCEDGVGMGLIIIIIIMGLESVSASEDVIGDLPSP